MRVEVSSLSRGGCVPFDFRLGFGLSLAFLDPGDTSLSSSTDEAEALFLFRPKVSGFRGFSSSAIFFRISQLALVR